MSIRSIMVCSLISDSSLEVELLMLEMNLLEDTGIGINMENGGEMLLHIHGSDMVVEKLLARRLIGFTLDSARSVSSCIICYSYATIITPVLIYELHYAKQ
jgi:hypothetical protein